MFKLFKPSEVRLEPVDKILILIQSLFFSFILFMLGITILFYTNLSVFPYGIVSVMFVVAALGNFLAVYRLVNYGTLLKQNSK